MDDLNYISSQNIFVFPTATRAPELSANGQYFTEYNLASIINRLVNKASFVINNNEVDEDFINSNYSPLEINIFGYYFKINFDENFLKKLVNAAFNTTDFTEIISNNNLTQDVYINTSIKLGYNSTTKLTELLPYDTTEGLDINNLFCGLKFTVSKNFVGGESPQEVLDGLGLTENNKNDTYSGEVSLSILQIPKESNINSLVFVIPQESKIKFTQDSIHIDDGDIDSPNDESY